MTLNPMSNPDPMRRVHVNGALLCAAHSKRTGELCGALAIAGTDPPRCRGHAGVATSDAKHKGRLARALLIDQALAELKRILDDPDAPATPKLGAAKLVLDSLDVDDQPEPQALQSARRSGVEMSFKIFQRAVSEAGLTREQSESIRASLEDAIRTMAGPREVSHDVLS